MRLVDADKLNKKKKYCFRTVGGCFPKSEWFIKLEDLFNAPTVDAVPVVRCKDCKWYRMSPIDSVPYCCHESGYCGEHMGGLFFCACGERKME